MAIGLVFFEGVSGSSTANSGWIKAPLDVQRKYKFSSIRFRCNDPFSGVIRSHWLATGQEIFLPKVWATADYPDAAPHSSEYLGGRGYHPLEELKDHDRNINMMLTDAEIARTTVEMNGNAVLIFPGPVHCEPHSHVSWGEFDYIVDGYGDIFFEIFDDENLLKDCRASNPVTALIGMDGPFFGDLRSGIDGRKGKSLNAVNNTEVHCEAARARYKKRMEYPSNGLCIMGCLRPAHPDEESYLRGLFHGEDNDGYGSDWRDESEKEEEQVAAAYDLIDGEFMSFDMNSKGNMRSSLYKLEIMTIKLFSVYGDQSTITLQDFQDAEPDALAHCASAIIERVSMHGMHCSAALKSLCRKKKGLNVEGANLIGVDSLGMDVRVFSGMETWTVRFSFNARAISETAAEKKIRRMLFPHYHRKNVKIPNHDTRDYSSF